MHRALSRVALFILLKLQELFSKRCSGRSFPGKICPTLKMTLASVHCCAHVTPTSAARQRTILRNNDLLCNFSLFLNCRNG